MKRFLFLAIALCFLSIQASAQKQLRRPQVWRPFEPPVRETKPHAERNNWFDEDGLILSNTVGIKIYGTDYGDPDQTVLNLGVEYFFAERFGIEVFAGMGIGNRPWITREYDDHADVKTDFRVGLETRIYWDNRRTSRIFFALNGFYRRKSMEMRAGRIVDLDRNDFSFREAQLRQDIAGVALSIGRQVVIGKNFFLELGIGIGYTTFNNYYSNVSGLKQDPYIFRPGLFNLFGATMDRNYWEHGGGGFYLPLTLKFGYVIH